MQASAFGFVPLVKSAKSYVNVARSTSAMNFKPMPLIIDGDTTFFSNFDSGNLARVEKIGPGEYQCCTSPDCKGTPYETPYTTWFHFCVTGVNKGETITIHLTNLNVQAKLYSQDMCPVYKSVPSMPQFLRIPGKVAHTVPKNGTQMRLTFQHTFQHHKEEVYFAFTYPYSYSELREHIAEWESMTTRSNPKPEDIYFMRETLTYSLEGRIVDLLTITNHSGMGPETEPYHSGSVPEKHAGKQRPAVFPGKRIVCLSARVHPGEVPASHVLHGTLAFLLSDDARAHAAREYFVWKIVPMLNPDGVVRGHYRTDTLGANLNRCYVDPDPQKEPTIYALKALLLGLDETDRLSLYVDFHGHATRRGAFMYGNALSDQQFIDMLLYPKLVSLNTPYFDFAACNFTEKNMKAKDKRDGLSKEGCSRVRVYQETGLIHCYTLEANYNTMTSCQHISPIDLDLMYPVTQLDRLSSSFPQHAAKSFRGILPKYIPEMYHDVGLALAVAALDLFEVNTRSRLPHTFFHSIRGVRGWLERNSKLLIVPPHQLKGKMAQLQAKTTLQESGAPHNSIVQSTNGFPEHKDTKPPVKAQSAGSLRGVAAVPPAAPSSAGAKVTSPAAVSRPAKRSNSRSLSNAKPVAAAADAALIRKHKAADKPSDAPASAPRTKTSPPSARVRRTMSMPSPIREPGKERPEKAGSLPSAELGVIGGHRTFSGPSVRDAKAPVPVQAVTATRTKGGQRPLLQALVPPKGEVFPGDEGRVIRARSDVRSGARRSATIRHTKP